MIDRRLAARILMDIWPKAHVFVMPVPANTFWSIDVAFYTALSNTLTIRLGVSFSSPKKLWVGHNFITNEVPDMQGCKSFLSGDGTSDLIGYMSYLRTQAIPDENDHRVLPDYDLKAPCINLYYHTAKLAESLWDVRNQTPNCITAKAEGESYEVTFYRPGEPLARIKSLSGLKPYRDTPEAIEKEALKARCKLRQIETQGFPLTQVLDLSGDPDPELLGLLRDPLGYLSVKRGPPMAYKWTDGPPTKSGVYTCEVDSTEPGFVDLITGFVTEPDGFVPGLNTRYGVIPLELIVRHRLVRKSP